MSEFPKAEAFKTRLIAQLGTKAICGVAITGVVNGDQVALVGPDLDSAMRSAQRQFDIAMRREGAQEVVLLSAAKFEELLRLAGITEAA
jgi:hypothetical protein